MKRVLFIAVALLMVVAGCKNRDKNIVVTPPTSLEVGATEMSVSCEAQKAQFEVVCNEAFDVKTEAEWLRLYNILEADGADVVVVSIEENETSEARSAEIVVVAGELRHVVTITQSGAVATSMEVTIGHRNQHMSSPKWGGEAVSGTINWGDGTTEAYTEGIAHDYADGESHTATFTMSGTSSFEIEAIGDMKSLTIAVE
jgi:hypothetical protein